MDKNRRGFMAWIAGFLGLGAVTPAIAAIAAIAAVPKTKLEGFIVFFVYIGSLPPYKAEAYIDRLKDQWKKDHKSNSLIDNWQVFWVPSRVVDTHAEFYPVNGKKDAEGRLQQIEGLFFEYEDKESHSGATVDIDDPKVGVRAIEYAMLMLGAPAVKVELDKDQLEACYANVLINIRTTGNAVNSMYLTERFVQEGVLAFAKMVLGRVRSKWINLPGWKPNCGWANPCIRSEGGYC